MDILKIVSITLSSLIIIILLRRFNNDYATAALCIINVSICFFSFGILIPVFDYIRNLGNSSDFSNVYSLMFKSAGISIICSLAAEICRDNAENTLASKIEFAGKCTLVSFCLPLIKKVFENAATFID